nr:oocyte-expressed protein homolog [Loxodonta africana]
MESNISQGETGSSHTQEKEEGAAAALREETRKVEEKELLAATAAATPQEEMEGENLPVFLCPGRVDLRVLPNWFQKEHLENPAVCDVPAWQVEKIFGTEGKDIPGIEQSTETLLQVQILDPKGMARISIFGSQEKKELVEANIYCQRRWLHVGKSPGNRRDLCRLPAPEQIRERGAGWGSPVPFSLASGAF